MNALDFVFNLIDKGSGPAKKIANALDSVDSALSSLDNASLKAGNRLDHITAPAKISGFGKLTQAIGATFGPKASASFLGAAESLGQVDDVLGAVGTSLGGVVAVGAKAGGALVAGAAALGIAGTVFAIGASDFKTDAVAGFTKILGSEKAASGIYEKALDLAERSGLAKSDAIAKVAEQLGKGLTGSDAIAAVEKGLGAIGDTVSKRVNAIGLNFGRLFDGIDTKPVRDALGAVGEALKDPALKAAVTGVFNKVLDVFRGITKEDVRGAVDKATGALVLLKDVLTTGEEKARKFAAGVSLASDAIEKFGKVTGLDVLFKTFEVGGQKGSAAGIAFSSALGAVGMAAGGIIGPIIELGAIVGGLPDLFNNGVPAVLAFVDNLTGGALGALSASLGGWYDAGINAALGVAQGISDGASSAIAAATDMASSALDAVTSALQIGSPSKAFAELGAFTSQGFGEGIANDNSAEVGAVDMASNALDAAAAAAAAPASSAARSPGAAASSAAVAGVGAAPAGRSGVPSLTIEHLEIHAAGGDADDIREAVERGVTDALELYAAGAA